MSLLTRTLGCFTRPRRAAVLAQSAGRAVPARRGTVLVLILGALAVISIVTLLYYTVGRSDTRTASVTLERNRTDGTVHAIADYLNDVVSGSTLAVFVDGLDNATNGTNNQILIRKTWDYPYTDPYRRSVMPPGLTETKFNPTGSYSDSITALIDPRRPYQPWLSTSMPTELVPTDPTSPPPPPPALRRYDQYTDWQHISNFSPDGRFVNLSNLAPNVNGQRISRFDAIPARAVNNWTPQAPTATTSEMSWGLTLLDNSGRSYPATQPQILIDRQGAALGPADPNIPAHWTMWQRFAFRLAKSDPYYGPGAPEYMHYQWADTDGDGFLDARWTELVDASNPDSPRSILPRDDRFRWFIAARAIDLSALVNVNSAMDHRLPAMQTSGSTFTLTAPLGLYPDVDLLRILRMDDTYQTFGFGYDRLQPLATEFYGNYNRIMARDMGERAYNGIRRSLLLPSVEVAAPGYDLATTPAGELAPMTGDDRANAYLRTGGQGSGSFFTAPERRIALNGRYGMAELLELLERRGTNNPVVTSRLEQATDGRVATDQTMGPLRSSRTLAAELGTADDFENGGEGNGVADLDAQAKARFDVRQLLTTESLARSLNSTVVPTPGVAPTPVGRLTANELPVNVVDAAKKIGNQAVSSREPESMFKGYANALLPYAWRNGFWSTNYARMRTLSYGNNPELALRLAAHLTANFGDMYDRDNAFSGYTLLLDRSQRATLAGAPTVYPWWITTPGRLDLTDPMLPDSSQGATVSSPAINVYGIEAQPFVTEVCSIVLLTDAPSTAGGDSETDGDEITIDGDFSAIQGSTNPIGRRNTDFLGAILGFQLTNPFDVPIPLSNRDDTQNYQPLADTDFTSFYLEYNGELFKIAREGASGLEGIVLRPGETRTFYVLSNLIQEMQERVDNAAGTASGNPTNAPSVQSFIDNQLAVKAGLYTYTGTDLVANGTRVKPIKLRRMDPTTGISRVAASHILGGNNDTAKRNVYLWRNPDALGASAGAGRSRHILADRLFDPGVPNSTRPTLDRMVPSNIANEIEGTEAGPESNTSPPPASALDNTGFTIALWGSVKRPDNPVNTPLGAIPAYCLEAKWTSGVLTNHAETDGSNPASLSLSEFESDSVSGRRTVDEFFSNFSLSTGPILGPPNNPGLYPGVLILADGTYATMTAPANLKRHGAHLINNNGDGRPFADVANPGRNLYPRIALDNNEFEAVLGVPAPVPTISTLRLADLLLPLAIGPEFDPGPAPTPIALGQAIPPDRCLTLSQALAVALNYSNPPPTGDPFSVYCRIGTNALPSAAEPSNGAIDRGHLSLSRFAPFEDFNNNMVLDVTGRDASRWPGIPLGLNVLNSFRSIDKQFNSLTEATIGQVNINTAPLPVMRALPLLSPTTDVSSMPNYPGQAWQVYLTLSGATAGNPPLPDITSDVAAAIRAYRDKTREFTRDTTPGTANFEDAVVNPFATTGLNGRAVTTQTTGLRELPGIASIGELLAITAPDGQQLTRLRATDRIDLLGNDNRRSGTLGTVSIPSRNQTGNAKTMDEVADDYGEKLVIAQSLLNSVNVRSDVFAIWFVVHGYQKSDTENLGPADPLVPSVAKRYLLVLDRSNVTRAGEKAKVLLFKELPM